MRVGFIGAGGTGKTTTMKLLSDLGLEEVISVVRPTMSRLGETEETMARKSPEERWFIQNEIFRARLTLEERIRNKRDIITDRTLLDHATYCFYYCANVIQDAAAENMNIAVRECLESYDQLFYFPVGLFKTKNDGFCRYESFAYQLTIDSIMRGFLRRLSLGQFNVPMGTPEERAAWVRRRVKHEEV